MTFINNKMAKLTNQFCLLYTSRHVATPTHSKSSLLFKDVMFNRQSPSPLPFLLFCLNKPLLMYDHVIYDISPLLLPYFLSILLSCSPLFTILSFRLSHSLWQNRRFFPLRLYRYYICIGLLKALNI